VDTLKFNASLDIKVVITKIALRVFVEKSV